MKPTLVLPLLFVRIRLEDFPTRAPWGLIEALAVYTQVEDVVIGALGGLSEQLAEVLPSLIKESVREEAPPPENMYGGFA